MKVEFLMYTNIGRWVQIDNRLGRLQYGRIKMYDNVHHRAWVIVSTYRLQADGNDWKGTEGEIIPYKELTLVDAPTK